MEESRQEGLVVGYAMVMVSAAIIEILPRKEEAGCLLFAARSRICFFVGSLGCCSVCCGQTCCLLYIVVLLARVVQRRSLRKSHQVEDEGI